MGKPRIGGVQGSFAAGLGDTPESGQRRINILLGKGRHHTTSALEMILERGEAGQPST